MGKIDDLNKVLSNRLQQQLRKQREALANFTTSYPEINTVKQSLLDFDLQDFKDKVLERLENVLIQEWIKYQSEEEVEAYDMIYFEYNEQSHEYSEAMSYGIFDLENYKLTIDAHDFGYDYKFGHWEAGLGLDLVPFKLTEPISYGSIEDESYYNLIAYKDQNSGYEQIWSMINTICSYVFNGAFSEADASNLFQAIKLKEGGLFVYDMHDNGTTWTPFYIQK